MKKSTSQIIMAVVLMLTITGCAPSAIHTASLNGNLNQVKQELKKGEDINIKDDYGKTPLHTASEKGKMEIVKYLVEHKAKIDARDKWDCTPLYYAAKEGHLEIVKYLINSGADAFAEVARKRNILYDAALFDRLEVVKYLIDKGLDVNKKDRNGHQAIDGTTIRGHFRIVKYLVEHGADIKNDSVALKYAINYAQTDIVKYLIEQGSSQKFDDGDSILHKAIKTRDLELTKYLVNQGSSLEVKNKQNRTPLAEANYYKNSYKHYPTYYKQYNAISIYLETEAKNIQNQKRYAEVNGYIKNKDFKGLKKYIEKNPNSVHYIKDATVRLLFVGPKGLQVGDIKRHLKNGKSELIVTSLINRVKEPYKEFSIEEIETLQKMGLSDKIISAMINVTTKLYEKDEMLKQNAKMQQGQKTQIIYQNNPNQKQNNPVVDKVQDALIKEGAKMIFDRLF